MSGKKVLVTGVGGYVGRAVADYLQICGHEIIGTYRKESVDLGFRRIRIDLESPFEIDGDFDIIVHAAGELPKRTSEKWSYEKQDVIRFKHNNVDAMENLVYFAKTHAVKKIIYLSTIGIYGQMENAVINEDSDRINPDIYGMTKYMGEAILKESGRISGISLRMPGIIGPGAKGVWLTNVVEKLKKGEDITVYTPDFHTKNFVWIDDLTAFIEHLIELDEWKYDTLVLACKEGAPIRHIVERIKELTKSDSKIHMDDSLRKPFCIDASKAFEMGYDSLNPLEIVEKLLS